MNEQAFIDAILASPEDDAPRLIYADWLDEQGQSERAEFIKVQIELASWKDGEHCPVCSQHWKWRVGAGHSEWSDCGNGHRWSSQTYRDLRRREEELWLAGRAYWTRDFPGALGDATNSTRSWRRGFVASVTCTAADWLQHAGNCFPREGVDPPDPPTIPGTILACQPIREVTLTTWPMEDGHRGREWPMELSTLKRRWPRIEKWNLPTQYAPLGRVIDETNEPSPPTWLMQQIAHLAVFHHVNIEIPRDRLRYAVICDCQRVEYSVAVMRPQDIPEVSPAPRMTIVERYINRVMNHDNRRGVCHEEICWCGACQECRRYLWIGPVVRDYIPAGTPMRRRIGDGRYVVCSKEESEIFTTEDQDVGEIITGYRPYRTRDTSSP